MYVLRADRFENRNNIYIRHPLEFANRTDMNPELVKSVEEFQRCVTKA